MQTCPSFSVGRRMGEREAVAGCLLEEWLREQDMGISWELFVHPCFDLVAFISLWKELEKEFSLSWQLSRSPSHPAARGEHRLLQGGWWDSSWGCCSSGGKQQMVWVRWICPGDGKWLDCSRPGDLRGWGKPCFQYHDLF